MYKSRDAEGMYKYRRSRVETISVTQRQHSKNFNGTHLYAFLAFIAFIALGAGAGAAAAAFFAPFFAMLRTLEN